MIINKAIKNIKKFGFMHLLYSFLCQLGFDFSDYKILSEQKFYESLPSSSYPLYLKKWYKSRTGKELNLANPVYYNEKMQWLKLYDYSEEKSLLSDKYLAPQKIKQILGDNINIIPQLGVWDNANDINFEELPEKFVLKCNHGSGFNIVCDRSHRLNIKKIRKQLNRWLKINYAFRKGSFELQYNHITRKIIAEKYIEELDGNLHDYKIHCFNGEPAFIEVIGNRDLTKHTGCELIYDFNWNRFKYQITTYKNYSADIERPECLKLMYSIAKRLSEGFKYVRVDLYIIKGQIYFGEMTFTAGNGLEDWPTEEADLEMSKLLKLKS